GMALQREASREQQAAGVGEWSGGAEKWVLGSGEAHGRHAGARGLGSLEPVALALEGVRGELDGLCARAGERPRERCVRTSVEEGVPIELVSRGVQPAERGD